MSSVKIGEQEGLLTAKDLESLKDLCESAGTTPEEVARWSAGEQAYFLKYGKRPIPPVLCPDLVW